MLESGMGEERIIDASSILDYYSRKKASSTLVRPSVDKATIYTASSCTITSIRIPVKHRNEKHNQYNVQDYLTLSNLADELTA